DVCSSDLAARCGRLPCVQRQAPQHVLSVWTCSTPLYSYVPLSRRCSTVYGERGRAGWARFFCVGEAGIELLAVPFLPDPAVGRVVGDVPAPRSGRRHDGEVVDVVARGRGDGAVIRVGGERGVATADDLVDRDVRRRGAVGGEQREGVGTLRRLQAPGDRGLEVVDLLELRLHSGDVLIMLVRRVGGPVLRGGDHLDDDELVGGEFSRGSEVVNLAAGTPRTA